MRYDILELKIFHTFSIVVLNVDLNMNMHMYEKTMIFKMSYPMTYTCYLLKLGGVAVYTHTY